MRWPTFRFRFGLRTLLLAVLVAAVGVWLWLAPGRWREYRNQQARKRIDPYELSIAKSDCPDGLPSELVAILGDSRLKHWGRAGDITLLAGDRLASFGHGGTLYVWDIDTGREVQRFSAKGYTVSRDRKMVFLAEADGDLVQWDGKKPKRIAVLDSEVAVERIGMAASGDGSTLVVDANDNGDGREISIYDVATGTLRHRFRPKAPGGSLEVSSNGEWFCWVEDGQVRVSRTATGEVVRSLVLADELTKGRYYPGTLTLSADDKTLYVGSARNSVAAIDFETGEELRQIGAARGSVHQFALGYGDRWMAWGQDALTTVSLAADGDRFRQDVTCAEGRIGVIDWHEQIIATTHEESIALWHANKLERWHLAGGQTSALTCMAFHPSGEWLAAGNSVGEIVVWETGTWRELHRRRAHDRRIVALFVSADGSKLVSSSEDRTIVTWDAETFGELAVVRQVYRPEAVGISPDGSMIATNHLNFTSSQIQLWDAADGSARQVLAPTRFTIWGPPAWSPDGKRLVCIDSANSVLVFDVAAGKPAGTLGKTQFGQQGVVMAWMSDSKRLVATNWGRDEVYVLEVGKTKPIKTLNTAAGQARWVSLHPSEQWIAVCGRHMPVQLWHLLTGKLVKSWQLGPAKGEVAQVHFSPDGHYLATVNGNGTAYVLSMDGVLAK